MIYLDNAATTFPKPLNVQRAVSEAIRKYGANPGRGGHDLSLKTSTQVYDSRKKAADFFGASSPDKIVFTQNCTMSLNYVIKGILKPGDHVIVSDMEHNAVMRPIFTMSEKRIISYSVAKTFPGDFEKTVVSFKSCIRPETKAIICMHASNVFGTILPIAEIGKLAHENGLLFVVDAAQSAGVLPIKIDDMNIDFLCLPCHKGLYGPMGTGMIVFGQNAPLPETVIEGGTGSDSINYNQPDFLPDRFESGTINVPGIIGVGSGIDFINKKGIGRIHSYEMNIIKMLYREMKKRSDVLLYTDEPEEEYTVPLLSFNFKGLSSESAAEKLNGFGICTRAGLHCAPAAHKKFGTLEIGTVRVCPSVFTSYNDAIFLLNCIEKIAKGKQI